MRQVCRRQKKKIHLTSAEWQHSTLVAATVQKSLASALPPCTRRRSSAVEIASKIAFARAPPPKGCEEEDDEEEEEEDEDKDEDHRTSDGFFRLSLTAPVISSITLAENRATLRQRDGLRAGLLLPPPPPPPPSLASPPAMGFEWRIGGCLNKKFQKPESAPIYRRQSLILLRLRSSIPSALAAD